MNRKKGGRIWNVNMNRKLAGRYCSVQTRLDNGFFSLFSKSFTHSLPYDGLSPFFFFF